MIDYTVLPTVNASLNAVSGVFLLVGYMLIRRRQINAHRNAMLGAFASHTLRLHLVISAVGSLRSPTGADSLWSSLLISQSFCAARSFPWPSRPPRAFCAADTPSQGIANDVPHVDVRLGTVSRLPDALPECSKTRGAVVSGMLFSTRVVFHTVIAIIRPRALGSIELSSASIRPRIANQGGSMGRAVRSLPARAPTAFLTLGPHQRFPISGCRLGARIDTTSTPRQDRMSPRISFAK